MILSDGEIASKCALLDDEGNPPPMIQPFTIESVREVDGKKVISHGLSSYGYDVRLARKVSIFTNINSSIIDPKDMNHRNFVEFEVPEDDNYIILPPNSYMLGHTIETFHMPRDVTAICLGKSTYARAGIIINVTPVEAGFIGQVVIEIANGTPLPAKIYVGEGIGQFMFFKGKPCITSYADRDGKYQNQTGITHSKV